MALSFSVAVPVAASLPSSRCLTAERSTSTSRVRCQPKRVQLGAIHSGLLSQSLHTSFYDGGESRAQLTAACAHTAEAPRGGAASSQMNIFDRVSRIVKSYVNAALSAAEDPEKLLDQTVIEMNEDLVKLRQATAQVLASQKQLENRCKQAQQNSDDWYKRAKLALEKGDEMLAKEALKRKKEFEDNANSLRAQLDQQKGVVEKLVSNTRMLESKIQEAKSKKDTLKARAQSAKTSQKVTEMLGSINTSSALAAFDKMEEKVMALEAESEAVGQLSTDELSTKFAMLEGGSNVDDELAALRRDMLGAPKQKGGELPAGRSAAATNSSLKDLDVERELNELRRSSRVE